MIPTFTLKQYCFACVFLLASCVQLQAQAVGINTTTPNGILEANSATYGIVLPRIALTATNVAAPIINPQGGALVPGTVIYNTSATSTGSNDVFPGIYVWTGTEWFNKFTKKHQEIFIQDSFFQPKSNSGWEDIPGLDNEAFTAKYTGTYKVEVSVNFGGGYIVNASSGTDVGMQEGEFKFSIDGADYIIPAKTTVARTDTGTNYYAIWEQAAIVEYIELDAGTVYSVDLEFDQFDAPGIVNNGNSGTGKGYIGIPDHVPCTIELTFIGD